MIMICQIEIWKASKYLHTSNETFSKGYVKAITIQKFEYGEMTEIEVLMIKIPTINIVCLLYVFVKLNFE